MRHPSPAHPSSAHPSSAHPPAMLRWLLLLPVGYVWAQAPSAPTALPTAPPPSAQTTPSASSPAGIAVTPSAWRPDNRFIIGVDGATLTGTNGGAGGNLGYLQQFSPSASMALGAQYQYLAGSHWEFGSLLGSFSHPLTSSTRWIVSAEADEGEGQTGAVHYGYGIEALDGGLVMPAGVTLSAEERQIDVDTSHGSLPKVGLAKAWGTHVLTSASYAQSVGGNLATRYGLFRVDVFTAAINLLAGGDVGHVSPAVVNIQGVLLPEARELTEVFFGLTRPSRRVDWTLLADDIDLAGIYRFTMTLTATIHLR